MTIYDETASSSGVLNAPAVHTYTSSPTGSSDSLVTGDNEVTATLSLIINESVLVDALALANRTFIDVVDAAGVFSSSATLQKVLVETIFNELVINGVVASTATYQVLAQSVANIISSMQFVESYVDGWAYNLNTGAPSFYENFKFNSFAKFANQYYGMGPDGLHVLDGDNDGGEDINALFTTAKSDLGDPRTKKAQIIYAGARSDQPLLLTCRVDEAHEYTYKFTTSTNQLAPCRVKVGKGLDGRYWQFEISNQNGGDFEIDALDIPFIANTRRV